LVTIHLDITKDRN